MSRSSARRTFLKGVGLGAFALPFLKAGQGLAGPFPKRLLIFHTNNGTVMNSFWPARGIDQLPPILTPLAPHKSKLLVMRGVTKAAALKQPVARDHNPDNLSGLTAMPPIPTGTDFDVGGISIDQHIANTLGKMTKFPSLQLGVGIKGGNAIIAARGPRQPLPAQQFPGKVFDSIFKEVTIDPGKWQAMKRERLSMIDVSLSDVNDLRCTLGAEERPKFDAHVESLHQLQRSLNTTVPATCRAPTLGASGSEDKILVQQMDIAVAALACDLTRVVTLQFGGGASHFTYDFLGIGKSHHGISHGSEGVTATPQQRNQWLVQIETFHAQQFKYLLDKLNGIPEGSGTMLDNSLVIWNHEQQSGDNHSRRDMPYVLAGGLGVFKMGRALDIGGRDSDGGKQGVGRDSGKPHNGLLIAIANAMGVPTDAFGDRDFSQGPMAGLTG